MTERADWGGGWGGGRYRVSFILKLWHVFNVNIYGISFLNCSPSPHLFIPRPTGSHSTDNWQLAARAEEVGHRPLEEGPKRRPDK